MGRVVPIATNFTAGEMSPRLYGRVDLQRYYNAAKRIEDFLILQQGGVTKRPGSVYVATVPDSAKVHRLIPFEFNAEQAYVLEFGDTTMRVYKDQGIVLEEATISGATQANPVVLTVTGHPFSNGDTIAVDGIVGMTELNGRSFTVANAAANTVELAGEDGTGHTAYSSGGTATGPDPFVLTTPYAEADLFDVQFAQSADTLWLVHPSYKPRKVTRTGHASWTLANFAPTADPFTSANNYPSCVTFFEQRIVFAATNNNPARLYFGVSAASAFNDMTTGTSATAGFQVTLASGRVNRIRWITGGAGQLQIGTLGDEYTETSSNSDTVTVNSISIRPQTNYGSANIQPIVAQNRTLFVQRSARRIREFAFVFESDNFAAPDLTILSEHMFGHADGGFAVEDTSKSITQVAYMREPIPSLWAVTADGRLNVMTYERDQNIAGWSSLFTAADSVVESVAIIPGAGGDEVWVAVKRTVNGATVRFVEYLHLGWTAIEDAFYVDSGLTYSGTATTTLSGLSHLEGETVAILADGAVHPSQVVASGAISLQYEVTKAHVGLPYTATLETLPVAMQGQGILGRIVGWGSIRALFHNTVGATINDEWIIFRKASDDISSPIPLFSGEMRMSDLGWDGDQEGVITVQSAQPLPCTITQVAGNAEVSDE